MQEGTDGTDDNNTNDLPCAGTLHTDPVKEWD